MSFDKNTKKKSIYEGWPKVTGMMFLAGRVYVLTNLFELNIEEINVKIQYAHFHIRIWFGQDCADLCCFGRLSFCF